MGGGAGASQRSSSPLKRRASSIESDNQDVQSDVEMTNAPSACQPQESNSVGRKEDVEPSAASQGQNIPTGDVAMFPHGVRADIPPLETQIKTIETLVKASAETQPKEQDVVYLVSRCWMGRALEQGVGGKNTNKYVPPAFLGPVDNADIILEVLKDINEDDFVRLKPGVSTTDFELFPPDAWDLVVTWYGLTEGQRPIKRLAHNTAPPDALLPNIQYELHPPVFAIHRLWSESSGIPIEAELKSTNPPPPVIACSSSHSFNDFLKKAKIKTRIPLATKVRLWRVPRKLPAASPTVMPAGLSTPPESPDGHGNPNGDASFPHLLVDVDQFTKLERGVDREHVEAKDQTHNTKYNGKSSLAMAGLAVDQDIVLDESIDSADFVSTYSGKSRDRNRSLAPSGTSASFVNQSKTTASGRNSPALQGPLTRGRAQARPGRSMGCTGLSNLGNTCYMNSALQCVRSVEELSKYFLVHEAEKEINPDNPLAHNGDVAKAYGHLLEEIYRDPPPTSITPRHFKSIIGRYAPAFSGYGQQDSQEFLGFLVDGLQEDLSRIKKKPYIEKPDSTDEMINNPEAIREMAAKVWDITKQRDDSVIADLFTGMYKSTLVCPVCQKISITFDPFNNLTLPLPAQNVWGASVKFFPLNDAPVHVVVEMDKNSGIKSLKEFISARVGVPANRLIAAEEFRDKLFKIYDDFATVSDEIQTNDHPAVYEVEAVPTNYPLPKKPKKQRYRSLLSNDNGDAEEPAWDEIAAERMVVPVLHRLNPHDRTSNIKKRHQTKSYGQPSVTPPHFIMLTPYEARSEDVIRRKVLEKVATFSTWPEFTKTTEADTSESTDPEMVMTTSSDADSSGDAKIVAHSVQGEDDMVDIAMRDSEIRQEQTMSSSSRDPHMLRRFNTRRPKWIDPARYLEPRFQNLFELSYFSEGDPTIVPTGWQPVHDDNVLPRLSTRAKEPSSSSDTEIRSARSSPGTDKDKEDQTDEEGTSRPITRMLDGSSDEDQREVIRNLPLRGTASRSTDKVGPKGRKKNKTHKTYSKKGKKRVNKEFRTAGRQQEPSHSASVVRLPELDGGDLVRLGEGIVVDWNEDAWTAVYGGDASIDDNSRGFPTFGSDDPPLKDPQLEARQKARQMRRKHGITLDDCLDEFEKEEILSEQDTWYCPRCKEHRRASKKFDLWKTPDILVVHLKRFSSSGWRRDKLDIRVDFPVEGLDLTQRVIDKVEGKHEVYDLIAVDDHWGGLGGGHYTAFAKNFIDGEWYEYNDSSVSQQKDPSRVVTSAAYLLFYRRRSNVPLGGPRFLSIMGRFDRAANGSEGRSKSGEDQRLGTGSSQHGSSSVSIGAGVTPHPENRGLASVTDRPPPYRMDQSGDDLLLARSGPEGWLANDAFGRQGGAEDEAVSVDDGETTNSLRPTTASVFQNQGWSFGNLELDSSRPGSERDYASDSAQHDSSGGEDNMSFEENSERARQAREVGLVLPEASRYVEHGEPQPELDSRDNPCPDGGSQFESNVLEKGLSDNTTSMVTIPGARIMDDDTDSDRAVHEIHVGDDDRPNVDS